MLDAQPRMEAPLPPVKVNEDCTGAALSVVTPATEYIVQVVFIGIRKN